MNISYSYSKGPVCTCTVSAIIIRLAPRAGKRKRILCSDWLPVMDKMAYLARSGLPALFPQKRNILAISILASFFAFIWCP